MHLTQLKMKGFKSFADAVELDLSDGISAIVGPNGSGKSNITDAIRWVLGEQSTKTLRGKKMEDVIFAGTAQKAPLGYAEVILILDNSDHALPDHPEELHVMRRLFRSGESEYRINNKNCKLKDIHQIFMDTGLGKNGYSLISQGAIEDIINSSPAELRNIVEEAVGIVNYKTRKIEAERKLLRTQDNMDRINDILQELKKRRNPLKKQAEKAKTYLSIYDELKKTDLYLFVARMDAIEGESRDLDQQLMQVTVEINSIQQKLLSLDKQFQSKQGSMQALSDQLTSAMTAQNDLDEAINACMRDLLVGEERLKHLGATASRLMAENEKNSALLAKILDEQIEVEEAISTGQKALWAIQDEISGVDQEKYEIEKQTEQIRLHLEKQMAEEASISEQKTQIMDEIQSLRDIISAEEVRKKISEEGFEKGRLELADQKEQLNLLSAGIAKGEDELSQKRKACETYETEKQTIEANLQSIDQKLNVLRNNMAVNLKQQDYLKRIQEKYSDYYPGIQKVMTSQALSESDRKGIFGPVGELIHVPEAYARAMEVALGGKAQNIVVATVETASRCIDLLKKEKAGRATFLPMDHLKVRGMDAKDRQTLKGMPGFVGIASELVQFDGRYQIAVDSLLSRIVVVTDFHAAKTISRHLSRYTLVTLEGEIFQVGGAIVGGANKGGKQSPFFKKLEIERLAKEYAQAEKTVAQLEGEEFTLTQKMMAAANALRGEKAAIVAKEQTIWQMEQQKLAGEAQIVELESRLAQSESSREESEEALKVSEARVDVLNGELILLDESTDLEKSGDLKEELVEKLRQLESRLTALKIQEAQKSEQLRALENKKTEIAQRAEAFGLSLKNDEDARVQAEAEASCQREAIATSQEAMAEKKREKTALDEQVMALRVQQNETNQAMMGLSQRIQNDNHELVVQNEAKNHLERALDRLHTEKDHLEEKIYARYTLNLLMARDILDAMTIDPVEMTEERQRALRQEMNALGQVNLSAVEEFAEVDERYGFLKGQIDDLTEAKKELEDIIQELYQSMEIQFAEGFEKLQGLFSEIFAILFEGGEAHLEYSDPEHIMESGIELTAQPPGKKLKHISLLSGGETSMTAIALLFAFLELNPSPFCVIDEIDAALDDANIKRFTNYMCSLADHIQFMLITHRKKTLEACDAIYGVTMSKTGISKLFSIRLSDYVEEV